MTNFTLYGLNGHELMPVGKLLKKPLVSKVEAVPAERPVDDKGHQARQAYRSVEQIGQFPAVLQAAQVMSSPVETVTPETSIAAALVQFQAHGFRHLPVVTAAGNLVGIISDRDVLHHLAGLNEDYQQQPARPPAERVAQLMTPQVLTADADTDIKYIARVFVERHIGAMPVMQQQTLQGIITRSDLLGAVMRHYTLTEWA